VFFGISYGVFVTSFAILLFTVGAFNLLFTIYSIVRLRQARGGWSFSGLIGSIFVYTASYALEYTDLDPSRSQIWAALQRISTILLPAFSLSLVLQVTHFSDSLRRHILLAIFALPALLLTFRIGQSYWTLLPEFLLLNESSYLAIYALFFLGLAELRLLTQLGSGHRLHRLHILLMLAANLIPGSMHLVSLQPGIQPWSTDPAPLLLTLMPVLYAFAVFGYRFLNYNPIARELVFDRMLDPIVLIDQRLHIIDFNVAAQRLFPELETRTLGESISILYPYTTGLQELVTDCGNHACELPETPTGHTYSVHIQGLSYGGSLLGRMIRFSDISTQVALRRSLELLATTDPLTGALNRRTLLEALNREMKRATRHLQPMAVLFLDLDHFKRINDTYGHKVGDEVLRAFATTIQKNMRGTDLFGRYGGEEFLFVLTGTLQEQAHQVAEKVRRAIAAQTILIDGKNITFTTSIGLAEYDTFDKRLTSEELVARADTALYVAKSKGRNRVVVWDETMTTSAELP